jgi:hypothetical protein
MKRLLALTLALLLAGAAQAATTPAPKTPAPKATVKAAATTTAATTVTETATLTWTAVTTSTTGGALTGVTYNVYYGNIAAGGTCAAASVTQQATGLTALTDSVSIAGLTPGSTECFGVSATAGGVTGALSNLVAVTVPQPPTPGVPTVTVTVVITQ